ncbi:MAG: adenosine kinase [Treponema sp.]|nr:adenosine kinase [Treponema sp.]
MDNLPVQLFCIGNAMVDVFAEVSADFCKQFALTLPVQHVDHKTAATILEALPPNKVIVAGGGAANIAKIAALLGIQTAFTGAAGNDHFGSLFKEELGHAGVLLSLAKKKSPTGVFISLTTKSNKPENAELSGYIIASPSAALELDAEDLDESIFNSKDDIPRVLFLEGFLLDRERLVNRILELAEKYRLTLAVDMGMPDIAAEQAKNILQGNSPFWDIKLRQAKFPLIVFFNKAEAEAFARVFDTGWESLFIELSTVPSVCIIVKLAEMGATVFTGGKAYHVQTEPVQSAESTGAGDAFAAGFLAAWLRAEGPQQCCRNGNAAAAMVLKAPGTKGLNINNG